MLQPEDHALCPLQSFGGSGRTVTQVSPLAIDRDIVSERPIREALASVYNRLSTELLEADFV